MDQIGAGHTDIDAAQDEFAGDLAAFARNITDEDNVLGVVDFNNNTAFVNEPRIIGVMFGVKY